MEECFDFSDSFIWKSSRIKSFKKWPFSDKDKCNVEQMAKAGFIFIGREEEPDLVECFVCGKQLDGWEADDVPWKEHAKHTTSCLFIKLNKPDEKMWTIKEYITLLKASEELKCKKINEDTEEKFKDAMNNTLEQIQTIFKEQK